MKSTIQLKVKIKTLAAEARIIKQEEQRAKKRRKTELLQSLTEHRKGVVRQEARLSLLAYGFLRGRSLQQIESSQRPVDWQKVQVMAQRYGNSFNRAEFESWTKGLVQAA